MDCFGCERVKAIRLSDGEMVCGECERIAPVAGLLQLEAPKPLDKCPVCATQQKDVERTGLLGCPVCYEVFDNNIKRILGQT